MQLVFAKQTIYSRSLGKVQQSLQVPHMEALLTATCKTIQIPDSEPFREDLSSANMKIVCKVLRKGKDDLFYLGYQMGRVQKKVKPSSGSNIFTYNLPRYTASI